MPQTTTRQQREQQDIENINKTVLKALEMLMGAGGHKSGMAGLSAKGATTILKGVATDHRHKGYKEVTMQAFQVGLQRILDDYYVSTALLTDKELADEHLLKLADPDNLKYILKIVGFNKHEQEVIEKLIEQHGDEQDLIEKGRYIQTLLKQAYNEHHKDEREDRLLRIEMMTTGALCYIPFAEPNDGYQFNLPVKDAHGEIHLEKMRVLRVNMSTGVEGPYYALNLKPVDPENQKAQDQMLFMGTNPLPTASGFSVTVHADTVSGNSVGENFVKASSDRFEKMIKDKYKENLRNLLQHHIEDFRKDNGELDYQKLWLKARVKCTGQSLGGSIPLQLMVKYPHLVETAAFEPPFLLEKHREEMERNLNNAHRNFAAIVDEMKDDIPEEVDVNKLKEIVPEDREQLDDVLKKNNVIIAQMIDYATKYGVLSPPAKILHVDTKVHADQDKNGIPAFTKIKDYIYRRVMAFSVMSHAMVLAGQGDKKVVELYDLNKLFSEKSRRSFTNILDTKVWRVINKPIKKYIQLKTFMKKAVYDPTMDPKKDPHYKEANQRILENQLQGKWEAVREALIDINQNPDSWQAGEHIIRKMDELSRMLLRAENLKLKTSDIILEIKGLANTIGEDSSNPEKVQLYVKYLQAKVEKSNSFDLADDKNKAVQEMALDQILKALSTYVEFGSVKEYDAGDQGELSPYRREMVELYNLLDPSNRKLFIEGLNQIETLSLNQQPHRKLVEDLRSHAKSNSEVSSLKKLSEPTQPKRVASLSRPLERSIGKKSKRNNEKEITHESKSKRKRTL